MQPGTEAVRVSPSRKPARELCFSLHQHWWSSWWLCVRNLRGIVLATFPEIAFSLRSQRCVALFQMSHVSGRLLYLKSLICTEEQLLVEKSVTCVKSHQIPQLILVHTRQARRAREARQRVVRSQVPEIICCLKPQILPPILWKPRAWLNELLLLH